jgi:hypothetical protein
MADPARVAHLMEDMFYHISTNPGKREYVFCCAQDGSEEDARAAGAIVARVTQVPVTILVDGSEEEEQCDESEWTYLFS